MGERNEYAPGTFNWVDLGTPDVEAAKAFYTSLFGWDTDELPATEESGPYVMCLKDGKPVAAVFEREHEGPLPPIWNNYVSVEDVDGIAERARELGGTVQQEPFDVMSAGRMAAIADPTGAVLSPWQAKDHAGAALVNVPGALTWNELGTNDSEKAQAFYSELFGWRFERIPEAQPAYWTIYNGDRSNGGMRELSPPELEVDSPSHWLPYFAVDDTDAALERARAGGAEVLMGPIDVPAGRFTYLKDPRRTPFALFEGQLDD